MKGQLSIKPFNPGRISNPSEIKSATLKNKKTLKYKADSFTLKAYKSDGEDDQKM